MACRRGPAQAVVGGAPAGHRGMGIGARHDHCRGAGEGTEAPRLVKSLVLDTGALIALDRNDLQLWTMLLVTAEERGVIRAPAGAIAQAWSDGARQVLLIRALRHCDE